MTFIHFLNVRYKNISIYVNHLTNKIFILKLTVTNTDRPTYRDASHLKRKELKKQTCQSIILWRKAVVAGFRNCQCPNCRALGMALPQRNYRLSRAATTHIFSFHSLAQLLVSSISQPAQPATCGHVTRDLHCSDSCLIFRRVGLHPLASSR